MAQSVSILEISNDSYACTEVCSCIPDSEDVESLALDNDITGDVYCEYHCYNIGEGESGVDDFISEEDLVELYNNCDDFEGAVEKEYGYETSEYASGNWSLFVEEEE